MNDGSGTNEGWRRRQPPNGGTDGRGLPSIDAHVGDLATAYALGALEPAERRRVDGHRRLCPFCDRLLVDEGRVVGLLPLGVPPVEPPPPDVKVALLARVAHAQRADAPLLAAGRAWPFPSPATLPSSRPTAPEGRRSVGRRWGGRHSGRHWSGWAATLALPLLLGLVATSVWAVQLRAQAQERENRADSFRAILERALEGDGAVSELESGPAAPEAAGWVVAEADGHSATLYVRGAESRAGQRFALFGLRDGPQVLLGTIQLDDRGRGIDEFTSALPLSTYRQYRVKVLGDDGDPAGLALFGWIGGPVATPPTGSTP